MKGLRFVAVGVTGAALLVVVGASGCGSTPIPPQVGLRSTVGLGQMATSTMCMLTTDVRLTIGDPTDKIVRDGDSEQGGVLKFQCTVKCATPLVDGKCNGPFQVNGRAELTGAPQDKRGTFTVNGTIAPKATSPTSPNMAVTLTSQGNSFTSSACTFQFSGLDKSGNSCPTPTRDTGDNSLICTANPNMDIDLGKVWGSVICEEGKDSNANPPRTCKTAVTFRFENCLQM